MRVKLTAENLEDLAMTAKVAEIAAKRPWLTVFEAACYMNIGESTLWKLLAEGALPSCKDGGNVRIARADIEAYWAKRRRGSAVAEACEN